MHDRFKKRFRSPKGDDRLRRQIAAEAARRLFATMAPEGENGPIREASEAEFYAAKRKAAAVLGRPVRPADLPTDAEVREAVLGMLRDKVDPDQSGDEPEEVVDRMADHVDRFTIYKMRLLPLESVKQDPRWHPEGDALYHSLQVFERARDARPFDEEFLLAALLHDVGKAIDPRDPSPAAIEALRGSLPERTGWLIAHLRDLRERTDRPSSPKIRQALAESEFFDDLVLLNELDQSGRVPGIHVGTVDEALRYLRGLEDESYLDD